MSVLYILWNKLLKSFYTNVVHLFTRPITSCTTNSNIVGLFSYFFLKCINFQINNFSVKSVRCHHCLGISQYHRNVKCLCHWYNTATSFKSSTLRVFTQFSIHSQKTTFAYYITLGIKTRIFQFFNESESE